MPYSPRRLRAALLCTYLAGAVQRASLRPFLVDAIWALFAVAFYVYKAGYLFGTGDHEELLPPIFRLLNPALYPGSDFVNAASDVQPLRAAFTYTLAAAGRLMPVHTSALVLHLLCLFTTCMLLMRITRVLFPTAVWAAPMAPILALTYFGVWTVGGNSYVDFMLLPHAFAATGGTAAALLFLQRRWIAAGAVLGLAALYQPLLAGHLFWMLALVRLAGAKSKRWRDAAVFCAAFAIAVSPLLIAQAPWDAPAGAAGSRVLFAQRYFVFRHGLHYLPSLFPARDWWHWGGLVAVALLLTFRYKHPARQTLAIFFVGGLAAMGLYSLLVEGFGMLSICAAQVFKASVWMSAAASVILAGYVGKGLTMVLPYSPSRPLVLLLPLAATLYCAAVIRDVRGLASRGLGPAWYRISDKAYDDLGRIHHYLRDSTARDAVVLTAPMDESLMCEARRTTPVSHKGFLHERDAFLHWDSLYHRIHHLPYILRQRETGDQSVQQTEVYDGLTSAHFDTVCRYDYRIARASALPDPAMMVLRREGDWLLLERKR